jgi:hypothetical protein
MPLGLPMLGDLSLLSAVLWDLDGRGRVWGIMRAEQTS